MSIFDCIKSLLPKAPADADNHGDNIPLPEPPTDQEIFTQSNQDEKPITVKVDILKW